MMKGIVKWFSDEKGFGFIEAEGKEYFLHFKEIRKEGYKTVNTADKVCFEPGNSAKGLVAKNVTMDQD